MEENLTDSQVMEIETEKPSKQDLTITPAKDPDVFHLGDRESLSNSKYMQKIRTTRIMNNKRLIIHKIILENFKSYQGIREIGPFHKVNILNLLDVFILNLSSLSPLLSDPMVQESQT